VIINARFNGPPGSGNGGYCAGVFSRAVSTPSGLGPTEVTLRLPPPLGVPLVVNTDSTGRKAEIRTTDGSLLAETCIVEPFEATVCWVDPTEAAVVSAQYAGFSEHPFPTCYVCGPERADGLRIFPGLLPDGRTAAPFTVPDDIGPELLWAALDCTGGWTVIGSDRVYLLGRMAAIIDAVPEPGQECVVVGARVATAGRKAMVHSTLWGPDRTVLATARATWIAI
jgi:hypothetical protein